MTDLPMDRVHALIRMAVEEDQGPGDVTSRLLFAEPTTGRASIVARESLIVSGMVLAPDILAHYTPALSLSVQIEDGGRAGAGEVLATIEGPLAPMLAAERVLLNFLQRLSGIATLTRHYVEQTEGSQAKIYDTRKTTPGWRALEKYAVRCGGGHNHRMGLYDAVLVKDNHLTAWGEEWVPRLQALIAEARRRTALQFIEVEVETLDQFKEVLGVAGVDIVLLDNMSDEQLRPAVALRDAARVGGRAPLIEASGGITLDRVAAVARTGIDRIAVGAITHSAVAVDIGMDRISP